jgi:hypothetical protein
MVMKVEPSGNKHGWPEIVEANTIAGGYKAPKDVARRGCSLFERDGMAALFGLIHVGF